MVLCANKMLRGKSKMLLGGSGDGGDEGSDGKESSIKEDVSGILISTIHHDDSEEKISHGINKNKDNNVVAADDDDSDYDKFYYYDSIYKSEGKWNSYCSSLLLCNSSSLVLNSSSSIIPGANRSTSSPLFTFEKTASGKLRVLKFLNSYRKERIMKMLDSGSAAPQFSNNTMSLPSIANNTNTELEIFDYMCMVLPRGKIRGTRGSSSSTTTTTTTTIDPFPVDIIDNFRKSLFCDDHKYLSGINGSKAADLHSVTTKDPKDLVDVNRRTGVISGLKSLENEESLENSLVEKDDSFALHEEESFCEKKTATGNLNLLNLGSLRKILETSLVRLNPDAVEEPVIVINLPEGVGENQENSSTTIMKENSAADAAAPPIASTTIGSRESRESTSTTQGSTDHQTLKNRRENNNNLTLIQDSFLHLPYEPFVVPGGRFREVYYWDTYWTILGLLHCCDAGADTKSNDRKSKSIPQQLAVSDQTTTTLHIVENMLKNIAHFITTYGFMPNGSRVYYLSRSQPPFFMECVNAFFCWVTKSGVFSNHDGKSNVNVTSTNNDPSGPPTYDGIPEKSKQSAKNLKKLVSIGCAKWIQDEEFFDMDKLIILQASLNLLKSTKNLISDFYKIYLPAIEIEYSFWMKYRSYTVVVVDRDGTTENSLKTSSGESESVSVSPQQQCTTATAQSKKNLDKTKCLYHYHTLNHYDSFADIPRAESFIYDVETLKENPKETNRNIIAACESGWDFSSRWRADNFFLNTENNALKLGKKNSWIELDDDRDDDHHKVLANSGGKSFNASSGKKMGAENLKVVGAEEVDTVNTTTSTIAGMLFIIAVLDSPRRGLQIAYVRTYSQLFSVSTFPPRNNDAHDNPMLMSCR